MSQASSHRTSWRDMAIVIYSKATRLHINHETHFDLLLLEGIHHYKNKDNNNITR